MKCKCRKGEVIVRLPLFFLLLLLAAAFPPFPLPSLTYTPVAVSFILSDFFTIATYCYPRAEVKAGLIGMVMIVVTLCHPALRSKRPETNRQ